MEPVEINAGTWYLRAPRADDRIDDRSALAELGETDPGYVARSAAGWEADTGYTWAVCEPTTGELLAEATLDPASGAVAIRARTGTPTPPRQPRPRCAGLRQRRWQQRGRYEPLPRRRTQRRQQRLGRLPEELVLALSTDLHQGDVGEP